MLRIVSRKEEVNKNNYKYKEREQMKNKNSWLVLYFTVMNLNLRMSTGEHPASMELSRLLVSILWHDCTIAGTI